MKVFTKSTTFLLSYVAGLGFRSVPSLKFIKRLIGITIEGVMLNFFSVVMESVVIGVLAALLGTVVSVEIPVVENDGGVAEAVVVARCTVFVESAIASAKSV
ncbi:hypothetical protein WICPIJ_000605 [Wickerhamomyces pijperi]|uniref:Uncharacterized protein n=1 Tax=Wickerhamomyces pijperi TaxID=599730 RepID=A0A9P8QDI7_WICPI|nr:hypothetical protein WICPIJ_000605 [Wickerhamomyces pijperi]